MPAYTLGNASSGSTLLSNAGYVRPNTKTDGSLTRSIRPREFGPQGQDFARNSGSLYHFASGIKDQATITPASQGSQKRLATGAPAPPTSKRMRGLETSTNLQNLTPIHQIEIARRAAASLPVPYHVDGQAKAAKRVQAARAVDCWALTTGEEREEEPSPEVKVCLQEDDLKRCEAIQADLRKPQTSRIRCIECLKLGKWRVWKNNHNGGVAQHIRNHLTKEHRFAYLAMCERINYIPPNVSALKSPDNNVNEPLTAEGILRYLTEWFAEDDISFNMVSHSGFRRFINYIGQGKVTAKDLPDRHTISAKAAALSVEAKERIKKEIKHARGRVSCTTDLWSDDSQRSFMCITAHFHNGHRRQVNRLIAFRVIEGSHTGGHLAETFFEVMEEFGIVHKLGWITMDNASNNDTMMTELQDYMVTRGMDFDRHGNRLRQVFLL
ncbi:Putative AC transposase OS=Zea mays PE=2 SV=2 [Rhizoctonia solani AG-1 IB]|uniref:Putative AC transposase n=1 Tax=Thanatephorus cucumeris (strain AG1-IB / isolate 7/3/14) TaxID=1108050 RepID=A0A0B7FYC7_THACB|nr:Putative AC transposase OS=Zea mays PE=2 SV=2 [Rhizoctonia solani AG-1 IB]